MDSKQTQMYSDDGQDFEESSIWFTLADEQGIADAQFTVGTDAIINYEKVSKKYLLAIAQGILSNTYHSTPQGVDDLPF